MLRYFDFFSKLPQNNIPVDIRNADLRVATGILNYDIKKVVRLKMKRLKLKQSYYLKSFKNYLARELAVFASSQDQQKNNIQQIQRIIKLIDPLLHPFQPQDMENLSSELKRLDELRQTPHLMNIYESLLLGVCYVSGVIMKNRPAETVQIAKEIFESLDDLQNPCIQFFLGLSYYYLNINHNQGLALFKKACENNYTEAFAMLGLFYEYGYGNSSRNLELAVKTYQIGFKKNCPMAQYYLGLMYSTKTYFRQDYKNAFKLIKPTAEFLNSALFDLGAFYENGFTGQKDLWRAKRYYEVAAGEDSINAYNSLVKIYSTTWYPSFYKDKFYHPMRSMFLTFHIREHYHVMLDLDLTPPTESLIPGASAPQTTLELQEHLLYALEKIQKPGFFLDIQKQKSSYYKTLCDLAFYYQWGFNNSQDIDLAIKLYKQGISMAGGNSCQWDLLSCYKIKIAELENPEKGVIVNAMLTWYKSFVKTDAEANFILAEILENGLFGLPPKLFDAYQHYHQGYLITQQKIECDKKTKCDTSPNIESMSIFSMYREHEEYNKEIAQHLADLKKNSETYLLMFNQKNILRKQDSVTRDLIPEMAELIAEYAADLPENTIRLPKDKLIL